MIFTLLLVFVFSLFIACLGVVFPVFCKNRKRRIIESDGNKPSIRHKNLRLIAGFEYQNGKVYYYGYCFGPLPFLLLGCYSSSGHKLSDVDGTQKADALEVAALYSRWGFVVAAFSFLILVF